MCAVVYRGSFANLRVIALNGCGIKSWAEVLLLEACLPQLQELYLAANDLSDIQAVAATEADRSPQSNYCFQI